MINNVLFCGEYYDFGNKYGVACELYLLGNRYRSSHSYVKGKPRFMILANVKVFVSTLWFAVSQHDSSTD